MTFYIAQVHILYRHLQLSHPSLTAALINILLTIY